MQGLIPIQKHKILFYSINQDQYKYKETLLGF